MGTTTGTTDDENTTNFQQILGMLPEEDRNALKKRGICTFSDLAKNKKELEQQRFGDGNVSPEVQMTLNVICIYLESLGAEGGGGDGFGWAGFENFCGYNDTSGELPADDDDNNNDYGYVCVESEAAEKRKPTASNGSGNDLTSEERRQMRQDVEDDPLSVLVRGFSNNGDALQFENDNKKAEEEASEKTQVEFNGIVYKKNACYYYKQPNGKPTVTVGIRGFTKVR